MEFPVHLQTSFPFGVAERESHERGCIAHPYRHVYRVAFAIGGQVGEKADFSVVLFLGAGFGGLGLGRRHIEWIFHPQSIVFPIEPHPKGLARFLVFQQVAFEFEDSVLVGFQTPAEFKVVAALPVIVAFRKDAEGGRSRLAVLARQEEHFPSLATRVGGIAEVGAIRHLKKQERGVFGIRRIETAGQHIRTFL